MICFQIHKVINSIWNKEELPLEWKESIVIPILKEGDKTDSSNYGSISLLSTMYKCLSDILLSRLTLMQRKLLGIINVDFGATDQLLTIYSALIKYLI